MENYVWIHDRTDAQNGTAFDSFKCRCRGQIIHVYSLYLRAPFIALKIYCSSLLKYTFLHTNYVMTYIFATFICMDILFIG